MTVDNIVQEGNKNPSNELVEMIDSMVMTYKITTEQREKQVKDIIDKGRLEGLEDKQIGDLIRVALKKHGLSDRTIRNALPDELKDKHMQEIRSKRIEYVRKDDTTIQPDREIQSIPVPEPVPIDVPVPVPTPIPTKVNSWDGKDDSDMTIEQLRERNRQNLVSQGKIQDSVYREPDRVAPVLGDKTLAQVLEDKNTGLEQSYHRMNVVPNVPVVDRQDDYTVTTQLQIYNGTGNNVGQFTVDVVAKCYPSKKTVELQPIDKASIRKKVV